jgi:hypothetical protein
MREPERIIHERKLAKQRERDAEQQRQSQEAAAEIRKILPSVVAVIKRLDYPNGGGFTRKDQLSVNGENRVAWQLHCDRINDEQFSIYILADGTIVYDNGSTTTVRTPETMRSQEKCLSQLRIMLEAGTPRQTPLSRVSAWFDRVWFDKL